MIEIGEMPLFVRKNLTVSIMAKKRVNRYLRKLAQTWNVNSLSSLHYFDKAIKPILRVSSNGQALLPFFLSPFSGWEEEW